MTIRSDFLFSNTVLGVWGRTKQPTKIQYRASPKEFTEKKNTEKQKKRKKKKTKINKQTTKKRRRESYINIPTKQTHFQELNQLQSQLVPAYINILSDEEDNYIRKTPKK
ncbi:MAG: hypothetical protein M5F18_01605 [Asgard group archaeon]|nr:hypothetical protein [Asgard group archaeon]